MWAPGEEGPPSSERGRRAGLRPGSVVAGGYRVGAVLGRGGTSIVYAARASDGSDVALKVLRHEGNRRARARLLREAYASNLMAAAGGVAVLGHGEHEGRFFLVLERLHGATLGELAHAAGGCIPTEDAMVHGLEVLRIVGAAHRLGVVHRDLKPENVFVTSAGEVRVLDFGLASLRESPPLDTALTRDDVAVGTPAFMPPELARGQRDAVDERTDLWQVGAVLFTLVSGRPVHRGETAAETIVLAGAQAAPPLRSVAPHAPAAFARVVDRALAYTPAARYPTAEAMAAALEQALVSGVEEPPEEAGAPTATVAEGNGASPEPAAAPRRPSRRFGAAVVGVLALSAASLAGASLTTRGGGALTAGAPAEGPTDNAEVPSCTSSETRDFYVVPTGAAPCSFVSITAALRAAGRSKARGKTVHIAPGLYNAENTGERFPLVLRGDVRLVGSGRDVTVVEGEGELNHQGAGGGLTDDRLLATLVVGSADDRVELRDLTVRAGRDHGEFHSFGVLCDQGNATATPGATEPNVVIEGARIGPGYDTGVAVTTTVLPSSSGCNARVTASELVGNWYGIFALGCGAGTGEVPTGLTVGGAGPESGVLFEGMRHGGLGAGVLLWGCVARAHIRGATFRDGDIGVQIDQRTPPPGFPRGYETLVEGSSFRALRTAGVRLWRAPPAVHLEGNEFRAVEGPGVLLDDHGDVRSPEVHARRNRFSGPALMVRGSHPFRGHIDLGSETDAGHNVFAFEDGRPWRPLVELHVAVAAEAFTVAGNTWPTRHGAPGAGVIVSSAGVSGGR